MRYLAGAAIMLAGAVVGATCTIPFTFEWRYAKCRQQAWDSGESSNVQAMNNYFDLQQSGPSWQGNLHRIMSYNDHLYMNCLRNGTDVVPRRYE